MFGGFPGNVPFSFWISLVFYLRFRLYWFMGFLEVSATVWWVIRYGQSIFEVQIFRKSLLGLVWIKENFNFLFSSYLLSFYISCIAFISLLGVFFNAVKLTVWCLKLVLNGVVKLVSHTVSFMGFLYLQHPWITNLSGSPSTTAEEAFRIPFTIGYLGKLQWRPLQPVFNFIYGNCLRGQCDYWAQN